MLKLGRIELSGRGPVVAAGFAGPTDPNDIKDAVAAGLDVAELRIDLFEDTSAPAVLKEIKKFGKLPTIATIRSADEGGEWRKSHQARLALFKKLAPQVDAIDIELQAANIRDDVIACAHAAEKLAVVSFHNFRWTPGIDALLSHVDDALSLGADIVKIATQANDDRDLQTLARLLLERPQANLIVIAMGGHGTKSRVFFPALGSLITFAALGRPTAPGQMWLKEMMSALRAFYPEYNQRKINELQIVEAV